MINNLQEVPRDAKVFDKFRKKAEEEDNKKNQDALWKKPPEPVNEPVPYINFDHLRQLDDPEGFAKQFPSLVEGRYCYSCQNQKVILQEYLNW